VSRVERSRESSVESGTSSAKEEGRLYYEKTRSICIHMYL